MLLSHRSQTLHVFQHCRLSVNSNLCFWCRGILNRCCEGHNITNNKGISAFLHVYTVEAVESFLPLPASITLASNSDWTTTMGNNLQLMQLLTEAPAVRVDAGYGVVTEVKLVERWKAIERAAVYFCQAVVIQVPVEKNWKELTDVQHWSNAAEFQKLKNLQKVLVF